MSEADNASNHRVPQSTLSADNADAAWRRILDRGLQHFRRNLINPTQPETRAAVKTSSSSRTPKILIGLAVAILLLIAIPIALIIRAESRRPHYYRQGKSVVARGESILGMNQGTAKPKPSPYKYTLATPITRPSNPVVYTPPRLPNSTASVTSQTAPQTLPVTPALPQTANNVPPPPTAGTSARIPFAPIVYPARHDKHFGGCSGQLTLASTGLNFNCASDPGDSIRVGLNEIGAIDENGVQTTSGKKYHFTISGMSKPAAQQLFSNWLRQVR
jgi:hypothetical protein